MLTGPVTILNWSYPRTDVPRKEVAFQLALALREEIWKLRLQRSTGQLQDTGKIRHKRHDLARILTVRREMSGDSAKKD